MADISPVDNFNYDFGKLYYMSVCYDSNIPIQR
jgi:hypothetical protein